MTYRALLLTWIVAACGGGARSHGAPLPPPTPQSPAAVVAVPAEPMEPKAPSAEL